MLSILTIVIWLASAVALSADEGQSLPAGQFVNPIGEGADPWVIRDTEHQRYLWCFSEGNRGIAIHTSTSLASTGEKHIVWRTPERGSFSREIWAPELHLLDGHWHIYFAASDGRNENHLTWVLRSRTADPLGEYELHGPLRTGDGPNRDAPNIWAIDMTVLHFNNRRYAIWSGWDAPGTDQQYLYIAEMASPVELRGPRVRLCNNADYVWERVEPGPEHRGLHEGPQVLPAPGRVLLTYSCAASWLPTYKLGLLELTGTDPLNPQHWQKRDRPFFESTEQTYGVGHSCFVESPDGSELWHVFHAKRDRRPGWRRSVFIQPLNFDERGEPQPGTPIAAGIPQPLPAGTPDVTANDATAGYTIYAHHQYYELDDSKIRLGLEPRHPINEYRSGEKAILEQTVADNAEASVTIDFQGLANARDAGLLFRCTAPSVGYDAQRGYFAGLIPRTQLLILGRTDGTRWQELARQPTAIDVREPQQLRVQFVGDRIEVWHNELRCLDHRDATWTTGRVGLRVVDTDAVFSELHVQAVTAQ